MVLFNLLFDSFSITHKDRKNIENLKNCEFESLRPRVWREIAEKKHEFEKTASLRGISVYIHNGKISIYVPFKISTYYEFLVAMKWKLKQCVIFITNVTL